MNKEDFHRKAYPNNPLGTIATFVFFIELISTVSLKFILDAKQEYAIYIVIFIIIFPTVIAILFFLILFFKREILYSPNDFKNDENFVNLLKRVKDIDNTQKNIKVKQDALSIDPRAHNIDQVFTVVDNLLEQKQVEAAIHLGQAFLKVQRYENALDVFKYIKRKAESSEKYSNKITSNLSYSLINLKRYAEAIEYLRSIVSEHGSGSSRIWRSLALSYSYFKTNDNEEHEIWLKHAKNSPSYDDYRALAKKFYPELEERL